MKLLKFFSFPTLIALCLCHPLGHDAATPPPSTPTTTSVNHILYLMHTGNTEQALQSYQEYRITSGGHDFELLERMGLILLDQGYRSNDPETQVLTLYGAGISTNEKAIYIVENGLSNDQPELQLISLNFLSRYNTDRTDQALNRAMASPHLLIRLEAALRLAEKKDPRAIGQIEALMSKVHPELWPLFPQLYAANGTAEAKKILRKLLTNPNEKIRIAAIESIADSGHDDFLPVIRRLSSHSEPAQQEACAKAFGILKDEKSAPRLKELARSPNLNVRLAAFDALYQLGRKEIANDVAVLVPNKDPFVLTLAGKMPGCEAALANIVKNDDLQVRINASLALLRLRDPSCLQGLVEILLSDARDLGILPITTPGKALSAWRVIPSAKQNFEDNPIAQELSLHAREAALILTLELPENNFLSLADTLLDKQQNDLIPQLMEMLENHPTAGVISLLKKHQQKAGAPLVRNYCNLALYRLKESGPYAENLREWVTQQQNIDLIRFRPLVPQDLSEDSLPHELTAQETSRLLVEAFESYITTQDDKGIDVLISIIKNGNSKNKYALIGLLLRAIQ